MQTNRIVSINFMFVIYFFVNKSILNGMFLQCTGLNSILQQEMLTQWSICN